MNQVFARRRGGVARFLLGPVVALSIFTAGLPSRTLADIGTFIHGTVVRDGKPVAGIVVIAQGGNETLHTKTDAKGEFTFNALPIGRYHIEAEANSQTRALDVDASSGGTTLTLDVAPLKEIGHVVSSVNPPTRASGTDVVMNGAQLQHLPSSTQLPDILAQLPSAARGTNGQIHINGDHNGLNYYVDGVQLPGGLNRVVGSEVDPSDIGFFEMLEGAYPAQYGDHFAGVVNIGTISASGPAGGSADVKTGSYGLFDSTLTAHMPIGKGGSVLVSSRQERTDWALDPPVPNPVHDQGSDANQFLRLTLPVHGQDTVNLDLSHSLQTFQLPPDTANGVPVTTDDDELQDDTFASLVYRHAIGDHGVLTIGPSYKRSRILDTNDLANDLAGSAGTSCTDFSNCGFFSLFADRTLIDTRLNADYDNRSAHHDVRFGGIDAVDTVTKDYAITLQANNQLNSSGGTYTANDTAPNVAHEQEVYLQDSWSMGSQWRADYGLRSDSFQVSSTQFDSGFGQVSPRFKMTRILTPRSAVYAYYGRLFEPFSFENVSPATAQALYVPGSYNGGFDLKPERDSLYELGAHLPLGRADVGIRVSHKVATDYLDDTQVGATNLHQDINFPRGRVDLESVSIQQPLAHNGRAYLNVTHSIAVNSLNCETQLLQNCAAAGPPGGDFVQADHDQHWDVTSGIISNDAHGGWYSLTSEYGSGLSLGDPAICPTDDAVNCKVPPHLTFDTSKGIGTGFGSVELGISNLLNDRYAITLNSTLQGTHYARPRTFELGVHVAIPR
ncbi:MAG TPA: TonB-dependent receptor [Candidatus Baltobacteraceae bacterium]|jgi:hypothetical protein|nr:TonB-dependent receptor [Candidatus Baltobacteraceae bacterium]